MKPLISIPYPTFHVLKTAQIREHRRELAILVERVKHAEIIHLTGCPEGAHTYILTVENGELKRHLIPSLS